MSKPDRILYFSKEQRNAHYSHLTIVGLKQWISDQGCSVPNKACGATLDAKIYDQVHAQGDVMVIATHPMPTENLLEFSPWPGGGVWRGMPMDLVSGAVDAVDLIDYSNLPPPAGLGDYFQALNAGFRIPSCAGTDATLGGAGSYPPGGYRVYVKRPVGETFTVESWMEGMRNGANFVSNYPLFVDFHLGGVRPGGTLGHHGATIKGWVDVRCILPMDRVEIIGNGRVLKTLTPPEGGDGTVIQRSFAVDPTGLQWIVARVTGTAVGWHVISAGGLFAQTGPLYLELSVADPGARSRKGGGSMPTNVKEEATERFLERLYLMDYLFDRVGEFPGDSRSAYEEARDVARDYFRSLCPDPPGAFNLVSPLDISYPHGRTWLRTTTPTFSWRRSIDPDPEDQVTYEISIDTTPSFTNAFVVGGITDTTYTVPDTSPLDEDTPYYWKVVAVDRTGLRRTSNPNLWSFVIDLVATGIENLPVTRWDIRSVWPNPFNPNVSVTYTAPTDGFHVVEVFDASGHRVRSLYEGSRPPGIHTVTWRGRNEAGVQVGSGVYFIRLVPPGGGSAVTRKAVLLK